MPPQSKKRKSTTPLNIDWIHSEAKKVILADFMDGHLSLDENVVSAETAFQVYKAHRLEAFADVGFDQFKLRLKDHRDQVSKLHAASLWEEAAFQHDRVLVQPRGTHNHRGEPIFDKSPAQELLRQDVKELQHSEMSPMDLWHSRPEYMVFRLDIFRHCAYKNTGTIWRTNAARRKRKQKLTETTRLIKHFTSQYRYIVGFLPYYNRFDYILCTTS
jgi:hypothetical protein